MTLIDLARMVYSAQGMYPSVVTPNPEQLAVHHALVPSDNAFQRAARLRQSLWREQRGYPIGLHGNRPLGSRLAMPFARDTLANYLTDPIREVVRTEVINCPTGSGQLYREPRIFDDMLSSQPLCFNAFGELQQDLELASRVVRDLTGEPDATVTAIRFEYSPGRGDAGFTGDRSAFDVFIEYESGLQCRFLGIEVKYVENMAQAPARFRQRYVDVAQAMGCFRQERLGALRIAPLEQLWRDHLLAGSLIAHPSGGFHGGAFVVLYPERNEAVAQAVTRYRGCLRDDRTFSVWTLERFLAAVRFNGGQWATALGERYLGQIE